MYKDYQTGLYNNLKDSNIAVHPVRLPRGWIFEYLLPNNSALERIVERIAADTERTAEFGLLKPDRLISDFAHCFAWILPSTII